MHNALKRGFTTAIAATTIAWSVAASFAFAPVASAAVASGDLVKGSLPAVYYIGSDMKRYVFTSDKAYMTWYADFSTVKKISDTDLAAITIGGNVTYKPGVKMVKIQSDPKVYAIAHGGVLRWVSTEAAATALYGSNWNTKIDDISDAFFTNYTVGAQISSASDYTIANEQTMSPSINSDKGLSGGGALNITLASDNPAGQSTTCSAQGINVLKFNIAGTGTVTGLTFTRVGAGVANDWGNVYLYDGDTRLTTGRSVSSTTNQVTFTNLNVAVAGTKELTLVGDLNVIANVCQAAPANVSAFSLAAATDVVAGTTVGGTFPVTGNNFTVSGSQGGSITAAVGSTPSNPKVGQTGAELANFKLTAGGNEDISLRRLVLTNSGAGQLTNLANLAIQTGGVTVAQNPIVSGSTATFVFAVPYVLSKGITRDFSVVGDIGSANRATVDTFRLYVDQTYDIYATGNTYGVGVTVTDNFSSAQAPAALAIQGGQVTFAFNGPTTGDISVGANDAVLEKFAITAANHVEIRNLRVRITAGAALGLQVANVTDCKVKNSDTGSTLTNQIDLNAWTNADPVFTRTFTDRFEVAAGQTLNLALTCDILSTAGVGLVNNSLTGQLDARVLGDIRSLDSNLDVALTDMVPTTALTGNPISVRASGLTVALASSPAAQTVTKGSTMSALGINFTAGSASDVKITQIKLKGMVDTDGDATYSSNATAPETHPVADVIQSATIWDGSTQLGAAASPDTNGDFNFSNLTWSVPAGTTKTITVKALISNNVPYVGNDDEFLFDLVGAGLADNSTANVTAQDKDSNIVTVTNPIYTAANVHMNKGGAGNMAVATALTPGANTVLVTAIASGVMQIQLDGDTPSAAILTGQTTDNSVTRVKFSSINEGFKVTRLTVENTVAAASQLITSVRLFDKDGTLFCSGTLDSNNRLRCANDAGLFTVANSNVVTIKVNVDQIGNGKSGAAPVLAFYMDQAGADVLPDDIKVVGVSSGVALVDANAVDQGAAGFAAASLKIFDDATGADNTTVLISGSAQVLRKTQPTVATVASSTTLINGQNTIYKFSVTAASNADVALRRISMNSSPTGIVADTVQVYENGTLLNTALYTVQNAGGNNLKTVSNGGANRSIGEVGNSVIVEFATERVVSAGTTKTYDIKANVTGAAATDSISTYIMSDVVTDLIATSVITTGGGTNGVEGNASANFIWSDTSADGHTATAAGTVASGCTADWTTGFLVKTLPTTPQSLSL